MRDKIFHVPSLRRMTTVIEDTLIIPEWVYQQVLAITYNDKESVGYLICRRQALYDSMHILYLVEGVIVTNIGELGKVNQTKNINVADPDIVVIEFHTHIELLGKFWFDKFSGEDLNTFKQRVLSEGDDYKHILFTPTHILSWAHLTALDVRIDKGNDKEVKKNFLNWRSKLKNT